MTTQACVLRALVAFGVLVTVQALPARSLAWDRHHRHSDHHDGPSHLRILTGPHFGIAGELEPDDGASIFDEIDLATTYGAQLGVDAVVFRFFAIGGEARFAAFNLEAADERGVDRSFLLDFDVKPRLRFAIARERMEFYFSTPLGLTVPILADDIDAGGSIDGKPGFNLGVGGGFTFFITDRFGLNVEPMYVMRWFGVEGPGGIDADLQMRQFTLFTNVVLAL
jgi:hypothetical protein